MGRTRAYARNAGARTGGPIPGPAEAVRFLLGRWPLGLTLGVLGLLNPGTMAALQLLVPILVRDRLGSGLGLGLFWAAASAGGWWGQGLCL